MAISDNLARFYARCFAEEVASEMRHDAVNGFGGLSALVFHLWRRATAAHPPLATQPEVAAVYKNFNQQVTGAADRLDVQFLPPTPVGSAPVSPANVARTLVAAMDDGPPVDVAPDSAAVTDVSVDRLEMEAMLLALLEAAREHAMATPLDLPRLSVGVRTHEEGVAIDVGPVAPGSDETPALGLRVARRLAARWRGYMELSALTDSAEPASPMRATVILPASPREAVP